MKIKKFKKIYIEITNKCNLNCSFCSINDRVKREMTLSEFEYILSNIDDYTDYVYLHVKGEPLLHSRFNNILDLCKKYDKKVNITTNGTMLKHRLDDIIDTNILRQINISLQSLTSDKYLLDILESIKKLLEQTNIQIVLRFWGLNNNKFNDFQYDILSKIIDFFNLDKGSISEIENKDNIKLLDRLYINKDIKFIWPNLRNNYYNDIGTCYGTRSHIGILVDGTIVPCCLDSDGIVNLGNIFNDNFEDVISGERFNNIAINFQNNKACEELCKHCSFKEKLKKKV